MKLKLGLIATAVACAAVPALANDPLFPGTATNVPEISALEGVAALAALAAVVALVWERRRAS